MVNIYELLRRNQDGTASYVKDFLDSLKVKYEIDNYGNIYYLDHENAPLLSAHMDTVRKEADFCIGAFLNENDDERIFSGGILGGDDKCGVYMILRALEEGHKANFIFSRDEEIGCLGIKALLKPNWVENKELADKIRNNCLWCLVLDRRGNSDIICQNNYYGTKEFEEALERISDEGNFGYKGATGLCSDANTIKEFVSTANISVGYYSPHSQKEYIVKADLEKAYNYMVTIIENLKDKFEPYKYTYSGGYGGYYNGSGYGGYGYYDYESKVSKKYKEKNKNKNGSGSRYPSYYNYYYDDYDDYDGYDYSDYTWEQWKNLDNKEKCTCDFCETSNTTDKVVDFYMPDGEKFHICEFCLEDMEAEIKKARQLLSRV